MKPKLTDNDEILFRQIHPNFLDAGEPSSDRFRPSTRDENMLSVDRSSIHSAGDSYALYTAAGNQSAAVFGLTVKEFSTELIECVADPVQAKEATDTERAVLQNDAHALADYSLHSAGSQKTRAQRLKRLAIARGKLFPHE